MAAFQAAPRGFQSQIADQLGVRVQAVNKWAKGYNVPEPATWERLEPLLRSAGLFPESGDLRESDDLTQLVLDIAAEIRSLRTDVQRMGVAVQKLGDRLPDPADPPPPKRRSASRAVRPTAPGEQR